MLLSWSDFDRAGDIYSSYFEISASQHDVLRDLALYMSKREGINDRRRLLMPRRETRLPKEWERNMDQPFNAQIVSIHTGITIIPAGISVGNEDINISK